MAKSFSVFVEVAGRIGGSFTAAVDHAEGRVKRLSNVFREQAAVAKAGVSDIAESYKGLAKMAAAGGIVFSVKHAFGDGEELAHELQALKAAGRSTAEVADGLAEANKAIANMPTATLTNGIKLLNETTGAYGDYKHAVENLQFNSKLGDVLKNTIGTADPAHELGSLIKALEIRGSASDPAKYRKEAEALGKAMVFYGGRLKADDIYTFASNAPTAIKQLDEKFLTTTAPALIQEMGGDKAGTGLTAFRKVIQGGITDQEQAKEWVKLGMITGKDVKRDKKTGAIIGWRPGAMKDSKLAYSNPLEFMEKNVLPGLEREGVDIKDPIALGNKLKILFKKEKANAFASAISTLVDRTRLEKDQVLMGKVLSIDANYEEAKLNDPKFAAFAIKSAMTNIGSALTLPLMKPFAQTMISVAQSINHLSSALIAHPEVATLIAKIGAALMVWQAIRFANLVFGIGAFARVVGNLSIASSLRLAARLMGISRAIVSFTAASGAATAVRSFAMSTSALAVAAPAALAVRLRALAAGIMALYAAGGARGVLAALGGSILGLGRSILLFPMLQLRGLGLALVAMPLARLRSTVAAVMMLQAVGGRAAVIEALGASLAGFGKAALLFPVTALRGIALGMWALVANPVGAVLTVIVGALAALGVWVYNNWSGIAGFFGAFGSAFMGALGPGAAGAIGKVVDLLAAAWRWVSNLLGPIDATGEKWKAWGEWAGKAVGSVVNALVGLPAMFADMAAKALNALFTVDWGAAGSRIASAIGGGLSELGGYLVDKLNPFSSSPKPPAAPAPASLPKLGTAVPLAGARALGGPVTKGLPYLVGERGPEIFVPEKTGTIETNGMLKSLSSAGGAARTGGALAIGVDASSIEAAGAKAQKAGDIMQTSLGAAVMPVVFTGSIDEATRRAEKLRAMLGAVKRSPIAVGDWSGGDTGESLGLGLDARNGGGGDSEESGAGTGSQISGGRRGFAARQGHFGGRRGFSTRQFGTKDESRPDSADTGPHVALGRMKAAGRGAKGFEKFDEKAPAIMGGLMEKYGLTKDQAAGVVGNLGHESARFTAYHEGGQASSKGGVGWAQWTGPRRHAFERWTAAHHLNPTSDEASWRFLTEGDPETAKAIARVKKTSSAGDAMKAFHDSFERSADTDIRTGAILKPGNWKSRLALAERAKGFEPVDGIVKPGASPVAKAGTDASKSAVAGSGQAPEWMDDRSKRELSGVNADLANNLLEASKRSGLKFAVNQGRRTQDEAAANARSGRGVKDSQHLYGAAADIAMLDPKTGAKVYDRALYERFAKDFDAVNREKGTNQRWLGSLGGRWGKDIVHFDQGIGYGQTHRATPFGGQAPTAADKVASREEAYKSPQNPFRKHEPAPAEKMAEAAKSKPVMGDEKPAALNMPEVRAPSLVKLAGARAMGGAVGRGLSYLVGEKGPEVFTPGATGQISTNGILGKLADAGRGGAGGGAGGLAGMLGGGGTGALVGKLLGSAGGLGGGLGGFEDIAKLLKGGTDIAPSPGRTSQASQGSAPMASGGGDRNFHAGNHTHNWNINSDKPEGIRREVESIFSDLLQQMASDQSGSLSD